MIDGVPVTLVYVGAAIVLGVSFAGLALARSRLDTNPAAYRTFDLLGEPFIRLALRWRAVRSAAQGLVGALFVFVIAAGLFGQQQGGSNIATLLTWTYWWVLLVLFVIFFGKAWCYLCPWDALAVWLERHPLWRIGSRSLSARLKWPRALRNLYPAAALFLGLTWLELGYGVTMRPELTAYIGLLMFFLSFGAILIFERRSFCRYGCLVGRIAGLYSLFASMEVRARDASVCRTTCRTYDCYRGNAEGEPCPTFQFLGGMNKNTYCIFCMECLRTCPHENVAVNLRWFGKDVVKPSPVRFDEAAMVIVMLAMSTFHGITMTPVWVRAVGAIQRLLAVGYLPAFSAGMAGFLGALSVLYLAFVAMSYRLARLPAMGLRQLAVRYSYAFLPIALFYHLAHNVLHFSIEGGALVPLLSDPFGWGWDLLGTASVMPAPLLPIRAVWGLTVAFILGGHIWSLVAGHRIALQIYPTRAQAIRSQLPMMAGMIAYSILSLWIVAQPMQMRTGL
jgi:polyferredoxin